MTDDSIGCLNSNRSSVAGPAKRFSRPKFCSTKSKGSESDAVVQDEHVAQVCIY